MSEFWTFVTIGFNHVLDIHAYDHVLFLAVLTVPFVFKDWKRVLMLVTLFTLGHTFALFLSVYNVVTIKSSWIEFLIPITILITALGNIFSSKKNTKKDAVNFTFILTLFFGIIHGFGFSNYFKSILPGAATDKILPLLEFALGIEAAQLLVVFVILIASFLVGYFLKNAKRDWVLIVSSVIIGMIIPMILESDIWK